MSDDASDTPSPPRRRGCGCWTLTFATLASAALFVVGLYVVWRWSNARGIDRLIADAREKGEPTTWDELSASYPTSPEIERTTQLWLGAFRADESPDLTEDDRYDVLVLGLYRPDEEDGWVARTRYNDERIVSPRMLEASRRYLAKVGAAVELAQEARRSGGVARFSLSHESGSSQGYDHIQGTRDLTNLLALDLEVHRLQKPKPPLGERLLTLVAIGQSLRNEPGEVAQLVRCALLGVADYHLARSLEAEELTDEELLALQREWEEIDHRATLRLALQELQAKTFRSFANYGEVEEGIILCPEEDAFLAATALRGVLAASDDIAAAKETAWEFDELVQQAVAAPYGSVRFAGSARLLKHVHALIYAFQDGQARADALETIVACERFRRAKGDWPKSLDELVPDWLDAVPIDSFSGRPMIYRRTETGVAVYTVGADGHDDGGAVDRGDDPCDPGAKVELGKNVLRVANED